MKIFIIAGEASGDQLGGALISSLKKLYPDAELRGVGGPRMLESGLPESLFPMDELSVMGIGEVLPRIPKFVNLIATTVQAIRVFNPDAVITIDSPDFCFRVQKKLKKSGIRAKLVHYVAPTVWAWRADRARKVAEYLDGMICLFPFEPIYFEREGLKSVFAGHPVMQSGLLTADGNAFRSKYDLPQDRTLVGLLCGSRRSELEISIPILREVVLRLSVDRPHIGFVIPTLPKWHEKIQDSFKDLGVPIIVTSDISDKWNAFKSMDAAIAVSGTVVLEIALAGVPHAILYRMNELTWQIVKRMVKTKYAHLGNILLSHQVYPEFVQDNATTDKIYNVLINLLDNPLERKIQKESARKLEYMLAPNPNENAADRAAAFIKSVVTAN